MRVVSCVMRSGALESSDFFLSYLILSLSSHITCQYTDIYSQTYIFILSNILMHTEGRCRPILPLTQVRRHVH